MMLWDGACHVHERFSVEKILALKQQYPDAKVLVHPECKGAVVKLADVVGSTAALLKFAAESPAQTFLVVTESGILHEMRKNVRPSNLFPFRRMMPAVPATSAAICALIRSKRYTPVCATDGRKSKCPLTLLKKRLNPFSGCLR